MTRGLVLLVAGLVVAGCGNRQGTIPESAVVDAMHRAGVVAVHRLTGPKAPSPSANGAADKDLFYAGPLRTDGRFGLAVVWGAWPATPVAADPRERSAVVHRVQFCNVDVSSNGDRRFDRVVALLRKACG